VSGSYARPTTAARAAGGTRAYDAALPLGSVQQVRSAVTPAPSKTDARRTDTRERILYEASNLFAALGYHATTTREIARAVGIRQPSLFHHFASKPEIMQALLTYDLDAFSFVEALAAEEGPAAVRLYRYLRDDVALVSRSPYNLSGLYTDEVMGDPDFALWARRSDQLHAAVEQIARDGIDSGEFVPDGPSPGPGGDRGNPAPDADDLQRRPAAAGRRSRGRDRVVCAARDPGRPVHTRGGPPDCSRGAGLRQSGQRRSGEKTRLG